MITKGATKPPAWSRTPRYRPGAVLSAAQLTAEQRDADRRSRLLNLALHGTGVVFGYQLAANEDRSLKVQKGCIQIGCGLALDLKGRMLYWPGGGLSIADLVGPPPRQAGQATLLAHYAERLTSEHGGIDCCPGDAWTERTVVFSLKPGCQKVDRDGPTIPDDLCVDHQTWLCARTGAIEHPSIPIAADLEHACDLETRLCTSPCGGYRYDPEAGVPIACVEICDRHADQTDCDPSFDFCPCSRFDSCCVRPFAYRIPYLWEMIVGADIARTRVADVSWRDWVLGPWERIVPFDDFAARAEATGESTDPPNAGFAIWFERPVRIDTLHQSSLFITIHLHESRCDYWEAQRVPLQAIRPLDPDGDGCVKGAQLVPFCEWVEAEITGAHSSLFDGARVEITARGQMIRDCCGMPLDARPLDVPTSLQGQSLPGADFITAFRVAPKAPPPIPDTPDDEPCDEPAQPVPPYQRY